MIKYRGHVYRIAASFKHLYSKYRNRPVAFTSLPAEARKAIWQYYVEEVVSAGYSIDENLLYESKWNLFNIPTQELLTAIMTEDPEVSIDWDSWEQYHDWYLKDLDVGERKDRWPIILGKEYDEANNLFIEDGWHRLHSYVARGEITIPALVLESETSSQLT